MGTIKENLHTPGDRLNAVIANYFESQNQLSLIVGVDKTSLSSYIKGRYPITEKFAYKLQKNGGINSQYILKGLEPMMIDASRSPKVHFSNIDNKAEHGTTKQYILRDDGMKQKLLPNGCVNVINSIFGENNQQHTFTILQSSFEFARLYDISVGSILILEKEYADDDLVLYTSKKRKQYKLGIYDNGKIINTKIDETLLLDEAEVEGHLTFEIKSVFITAAK